MTRLMVYKGVILSLMDIFRFFEVFRPGPSILWYTSGMNNYITYYRVSTDHQGSDGLGIQSQRSAVQYYTGLGTVLAEFMEVESGRNSERPELAKALELAKQTGATLVVAKLDRLARSVWFIAQLMKSGVEFIACDMPNANRMTIQMMAVFAEQEARMISQRTTAALSVAKKNGVKLGASNPKYWETRKKNSFARKKVTRAKHQYTPQMVTQVCMMRNEGKTLGDIATALNAQGWTTAKGKAFQAMTVKRILDKQLVVA